MKIEEIRTEWLRVPIDPPIADSTHELRFLDLVVVEVCSEGLSGWSYMLSFDYGTALMKNLVDAELRPKVLGKDATAKSAAAGTSRPPSTWVAKGLRCGARRPSIRRYGIYWPGGLGFQLRRSSGATTQEFRCMAAVDGFPTAMSNWPTK
jgi:hypothetical protein